LRAADNGGDTEDWHSHNPQKWNVKQIAQFPLSGSAHDQLNYLGQFSKLDDNLMQSQMPSKVDMNSADQLC